MIEINSIINSLTKENSAMSTRNTDNIGRKIALSKKTKAKKRITDVLYKSNKSYGVRTEKDSLKVRIRNSETIGISSIMEGRQPGLYELDEPKPMEITINVCNLSNAGDVREVNINVIVDAIEVKKNRAIFYWAFCDEDYFPILISRIVQVKDIQIEKDRQLLLVAYTDAKVAIRHAISLTQSIGSSI